jgi:plastocyanin
MRRARHWSLTLVFTVMGSRPVAGVAEGEVSIRLFQFQPAGIEVVAGSRVTWVNADAIEHTVTSGDGERPDDLFHGVVAGRGSHFTTTFDRPGVYAYYCGRHHFMRGEIRVTPRKAGT